MKLHLGCGEVYLEGYTNVDFPLSKHSLQTRSVADELADVTKLRYAPNSIDEVRNHHFFEHFVRPQALGLLSSWQSWLKVGGTIHIEVPDFNRTAKIALSRRQSVHNRAVAIRHIFGSNEADWAVHYEGWSKDTLKRALELHGFGNFNFVESGYLATRNITVTAAKTTKLSKSALRNAVSDYLANYLVDPNSPSEAHLLDLWMNDYDQQVKKSWAEKATPKPAKKPRRTRTKA